MLVNQNPRSFLPIYNVLMFFQCLVGIHLPLDGEQFIVSVSFLRTSLKLNNNKYIRRCVKAGSDRDLMPLYHFDQL